VELKHKLSKRIHGSVLNIHRKYTKNFHSHSIIVFYFVSRPASWSTNSGITTGSRHPRSTRGRVWDSPAKPKSGIACTKTNSGMIFYSSNLSLRGARSLNYLEVFANGVIPCPGSPQVITGRRKNNARGDPILGGGKSVYGEQPDIASQFHSLCSDQQAHY